MNNSWLIPQKTTDRGRYSRGPDRPTIDERPHEPGLARPSSPAPDSCEVHGFLPESGKRTRKGKSGPASPGSHAPAIESEPTGRRGTGQTVRHNNELQGRLPPRQPLHFSPAKLKAESRSSEG